MKVFHLTRIAECMSFLSSTSILWYNVQDTGVKIAAMDATAHDVPKNFDVQGYPTLYFLPAGSKKPVSYDGAREEKAMIEFIK